VDAYPTSRKPFYQTVELIEKSKEQKGSGSGRNFVGKEVVEIKVHWGKAHADCVVLLGPSSFSRVLC
jgi:hypothetical protein